MTNLFMRAFGDLPSAAEATITIGDYRRLLPISILNGSVATGHHWYGSVPIATNVGRRWQKSERTLYLCMRICEV